MKLTDAATFLTLCWIPEFAAAATAHVYIHDAQPRPRSDAHATTLSPVSTRLVLAQRAGVEDYHRSDLLRAEVIDAINEFGTRTPLFTTEDDGARKAFILVEGDESTESKEGITSR